MADYQIPLFDKERSEYAKQEGMERAALNRSELLALAQEVAINLGQMRGEVNMDMVWRQLTAWGYQPEDLGNAAGSVFPNDVWEWTGKVVSSERVSRHRNMLRVWRLRDS